MPKIRLALPIPVCACCGGNLFPPQPPGARPPIVQYHEPTLESGSPQPLCSSCWDHYAALLDEGVVWEEILAEMNEHSIEVLLA